MEKEDMETSEDEEDLTEDEDDEIESDIEDVEEVKILEHWLIRDPILWILGRGRRFELVSLSPHGLLLECTLKLLSSFEAFLKKQLLLLGGFLCAKIIC